MSDKWLSSLGELEALVLLAVMRAAPNAYGVTVRDALHRGAGRSLTLGSVYKTLSRLERKGLLETTISDPEPRRGGRRRKLYQPTPQGRRVLSRTLASLTRMAQGLEVAWDAG